MAQTAKHRARPTSIVQAPRALPFVFDHEPSLFGGTCTVCAVAHLIRYVRYRVRAEPPPAGAVVFVPEELSYQPMSANP